MSLPFFEFKIHAKKKPRKKPVRKPKVKPKVTKKVKPEHVITKIGAAPRCFIATYPVNFAPLAGHIVAWGLTKEDAQWMAANHANASFPGMCWTYKDFDVHRLMKTGHVKKLTNNRWTKKEK